jgi:hypothetical protein
MRVMDVRIFVCGRPTLITYLKPLIEVNPMSMSIHISIFYLRPYYKSQLAMWIHYWHTQTLIWIEIAMTDGYEWIKIDY